MRKQFSILVVSVVAALSLTADPQDGILDIPYEEYSALRAVEGNSKRPLPKLDYWGARSFQWGDDGTTVSAAAQIEREDGEFAGLSCRRELKSDVSERGLNRIRYSFASGISNRETRLQQYHVLKQQLVSAYHSPTHNIRSDEIFRGQDAYVQGLDKEYRVEWRGPETIVCLALSDEHLFLEFRQAPTSRAKEMKERVKRGRETQKRIQEQLRRISEPQRPQTKGQ